MAQAKEPAAAEKGEGLPADDKPVDDAAHPGKKDDGADTASIADQRKALREKRAALNGKWMAGAITDAERAQKVDAIDDPLDDLLMQATRANTLAYVNRQNAINDQVRVIDSIRHDGAKMGIDYKPDGDAAGQFDTALQVPAVPRGDPAKWQSHICWCASSPASMTRTGPKRCWRTCRLASARPCCAPR